MFSKNFFAPLNIALLTWLASVGPNTLSTAFGYQAPNRMATDPMPSNPGAILPNNGSDSFAPSTPVMNFQDPTGQTYGRYVAYETVPVLGYSYQEVKERVYVPKTVNELRTVTVTEYTPFQSYEPQLRNVPNWNPFAAPQQVWQYVSVIRYQPNYKSVNQPVSFVRYEEQEVTRKIPVLMSQTQQLPRFVDRPIGVSANGGNTVANLTPAVNGLPSVANNNMYQHAAQTAQANRNTSNFATRSIDTPNIYPYRNGVGPAGAPYNGTPQVGNPYNSPYVNPNGYATTASRPMFPWPAFASGTGSLFGSNLFASNRNAGYPAANSYVASSAPANQSYLWGNSTNGLGFRPSTATYATPQQNWGMSSGASYRDPMQGGMPATVMR